MEELLSQLLKKYWLSYKSIFIVLIICGAFCISALPQEGEGLSLRAQLSIILSVIVLVLYLLACVKHNALPKAKRNSVAVLFVVDAENDSFYKDVKNKLISSFAENINSNRDAKIEALCVKKEQLKNYSFTEKDIIIPILEKTGAVFLADIKYRVDCQTNAEHFEMKINYGVLHPIFQQNKTQVLIHDMNTMRKNLAKKRFNKAQLLDQFEYTSQALSLVCQYVMGFVLLLSGQAQEAYEYLSRAYIEAKGASSIIDQDIFRLIESRFVDTCYIAASIDTEQFENTKDTKFLEKMNTRIEEAISIKPGNPDYFIAKAYYAIIIERDPVHARALIDYAKKIDSKKIWRYSDAFIDAYIGKESHTIYKKYKKAFTVDYNLVRIADFIEYILEQEPERIGLNLAAALVYDQLGDTIRAKQYYSRCLEYEKDNVFKEQLSQKIANI